MRDLKPHTDARHLLRRWVTDYFNRHDPAACAEFIAPDYSLHIGDTVFSGRDTEWLPAVNEQMQLFPGLAMTVHHVVSGEGWAAAYFSEHGARDGKSASWSGIGIYFSDGGVLTSCIAQEDYMTRARQLKSGIADPVEPPAVAPWDGVLQAADPAAEAVVLDWLSGSWPTATEGIRVDDEHITGTALEFDVAEVTVNTLLSAGEDVVFHAVQGGRYLAGLPGQDAPGQAHLHANGILRVRDGRILGGRIIRDRIALRAQLRKATK